MVDLVIPMEPNVSQSQPVYYESLLSLDIDPHPELDRQDCSSVEVQSCSQAASWDPDGIVFQLISDRTRTRGEMRQISSRDRDEGPEYRTLSEEGVSLVGETLPCLLLYAWRPGARRKMEYVHPNR